MWFICYPEINELKNLPFYTVSVGMHIWQYPTPRENGYCYPQFLYSNHGKGILKTEGLTIEIPENSIVFLPAHTPHYYEAITDVWDVRWFVPSGTETNSLLEQFGFNKCKVFPIQNIATLDELQNKIHMAFQINTKNSIFFSASYTYEFLFEFYRQYKNFEETPAFRYRKRLTPVVEYIEHNFDKEITQQKLCEMIKVSPQHLCRMFKQCFETRPMEYVNHTRIDHACYMLQTSERSIEQISYNVGYNNVNYFCKTFKKYTGLTPGSYRTDNIINTKYAPQEKDSPLN